ncbi:MAG: ABC transporter permease [Hyphomicrobiales bacterium]
MAAIDRQDEAIGTTGGALRQVGLPAAAIVTLLLVWQGAVTVFAIPAFILPGPVRVAQALVGKAGFLAGHAMATGFEIVAGLVAGTLAGVVTALLMSRFLAARQLLYPLVVVSQALPVFAIAPLLVLWLGYGLASKVAMAAIIIYFPIASAFFDGLTRTDPGLLDLARIAGASRLQTLLTIKVPAALPSLGSGLKVAAAVAPIGAVVGEWVGASEGLGFIMLHANARMQTDVVFAALAVLAMLALFFRFAVDRLVAATMRYEAGS